jgi:hypothetical protein
VQDKKPGIVSKGVPASVARTFSRTEDFSDKKKSNRLNRFVLKTRRIENRKFGVTSSPDIKRRSGEWLAAVAVPTVLSGAATDPAVVSGTRPQPPWRSDHMI